MTLVFSTQANLPSTNNSSILLVISLHIMFYFGVNKLFLYLFLGY